MDHHLTENSTDHLFVSQTTQHFTENPKHLSHNHSIPLWNALLKYCAFFWLLWRWEAKTPSKRIWNLNFCIYSFKCLPTTLAMLLVLLNVTEKAGAFLQLAFRTLDFRWWQADDAPLVSSGSTMGGMRSGSSSSPACSPVARIRLRSKKSGTSMAKSVEKTSVSKPESNGRLHYLMFKTIKKSSVDFLQVDAKLKSKFYSNVQMRQGGQEAQKAAELLRICPIENADLCRVYGCFNRSNRSDSIFASCPQSEFPLPAHIIVATRPWNPTSSDFLNISG